MRGQFNAADAHITASVVQYYAFVLLTASAVRILAPAFYAIHNTKIPTLASLISLIVHVILVQLLLKPYGLLGLVGSTVISAAINMTILFILHQKLIGHLELGVLLKSIGKYLLAAAGMSIVIMLMNKNLITAAEGTLYKIFALAVTIALGVATYGAIAYLLKVKELNETLALFKRKLRR